MNISESFITALSYINQPSKRRLIKEALKLNGKTGIEVGGPSAFFKVKGGCPVYLFAKQVDGVNFSTETVWEGKIEQGNTYNYFHHKSGYQYIGEASDLNSVDSDKYDFLLSCHSLEHVANPIKALKEWNRVMKKGGKLILVLPDKEITFDKLRPYTTFQHLLEDFEIETTENDTTHFSEIMDNYLDSKESFIQSKEELAKVLQDNYTNRCVHHHVFSQELVKQVLEYCGFKVKYQTKLKPFHLVTLAEKG